MLRNVIQIDYESLSSDSAAKNIKSVKGDDGNKPKTLLLDVDVRAKKNIEVSKFFEEMSIN